MFHFVLNFGPGLLLLLRIRSVVLTNTGIFLRGLKLSGESRTQQVLLESKMKIEGNHVFFRDNKASIWKKKRHTFALYFTAF